MKETLNILPYDLIITTLPQQNIFIDKTSALHSGYIFSLNSPGSIADHLLQIVQL